MFFHGPLERGCCNVFPQGIVSISFAFLQRVAPHTLLVSLLFFLIALSPTCKELESLVSKKLEKDGMVGMAVAGGAALAVGG